MCCNIKILGCLYCNTSIVAGRAVGGKNCIAIQNCIATERLGSWAARRARRWALGWACSRPAAGTGARGHSAGVSEARGRARGAQGSAELADGKLAGMRWAQAAGAGAREERHGMGAQGSAERRLADARGARLGAQLDAQGAAWAQVGHAGWVSWAKLVHCAPGSVLTQFLNPV